MEARHLYVLIFLAGVSCTWVLQLFTRQSGWYWAPPQYTAVGGGDSSEGAQCGFQPLRLEGGSPSNPLWRDFEAYRRGPAVHKWTPYWDVYHRYFQRFRGRHVRLLEIGVQSGGTIGLWQRYFGSQLVYYGVDINQLCFELFHAPPAVNIFVGSQDDPLFWDVLRKGELKFDIIIDDGGHEMNQQITTFNETWDMLVDGGIYLCEDMSTSYDMVDTAKLFSTETLGGGYGREGTFAAFSKQFVDLVNGHYVDREKAPQFDPRGLRNQIVSASFFDQMVVLEKGVHKPQTHQRHGNFSLPYVPNDSELSMVETYREQLRWSLGEDEGDSVPPP